MNAQQQNGEITSFMPGWYWLGQVPVYAVPDARPGWARYCVIHANKQAPLDPVAVQSRCPASQLLPATPPGLPNGVAQPTDSMVREAYLRWQAAKRATTSVLLVGVSNLPDVEYVTFDEDAETVSLVYGVSPGIYNWCEFAPKRPPLLVCALRPGYAYALTKELRDASVGYDYVPETAGEG